MWLILLINLYKFPVSASSVICVSFKTSQLMSGFECVIHAGFARRERDSENCDSMGIPFTLEMYSF